MQGSSADLGWEIQWTPEEEPAAGPGGGWAWKAIWLPALAAEEVFQQQESCVALLPAPAVFLVGAIGVELLCAKVLSVACQLMAV